MSDPAIMTKDAEPGYASWHITPGGDRAMTDAHTPYWRHFIDVVPERDLSDRDVLDVGCNRGGFLRLLHQTRPFRSGIGIDIASDSLSEARTLTNEAPVNFHLTGDPARWSGAFDMAFSYEVIYLLPDLDAHAAAMRTALKPGGIYYAVTGCHTESPLWPVHRDFLARTSNAPVQDRSPDDYMDAFARLDFEVTLRRFGFQGFVPPRKPGGFHPKVTDALSYGDDKLLFRFVRRG
jgi:SAM-dependent methyltransferase